jgi:hypothetical protein
VAQEVRNQKIQDEAGNQLPEDERRRQLAQEIAATLCRGLIVDLERIEQAGLR